MSNLVNKKGLAGIVTISILILVAVSSSMLLYKIIGNVSNQLSPAFSCTDLKIGNTLSVTDFIQNENILEVDVLRSFSKSDIKGFEILVKDSSGSVSKFGCGEICSLSGSCVVPLQGQKKTIYLDVTGNQKIDAVGISVNGCSLSLKEIP